MYTSDNNYVPRYRSCSVADPDPGSGAFLTPGWVKSQDPDLGWTTRIIVPRAKKPFFWHKILKFFDVDLGSGIEKIRIRDPGWKKFGSGRSWIRFYVWRNGNHRNFFFLQAPSFAVKISMCSPVGIFYLSLLLEEYFSHKVFWWSSDPLKIQNYG